MSQEKEFKRFFASSTYSYRLLPSQPKSLPILHQPGLYYRSSSHYVVFLQLSTTVNLMSNSNRIIPINSKVTIELNNNKVEKDVGVEEEKAHFDETEGELDSDEEGDDDDEDDENDEFLEAEDDETFVPTTTMTNPTTITDTLNSISLNNSPSLPTVTTTEGAVPSQSKAAKLVSEAMIKPHEENIRTSKSKGKKLEQLNYDDVKMSKEEMELDFKVVWKALHLFLNSRMIEAETICSSSPHSLYYSLGFSFIQCLKALATYEPEDLESAIQSCKNSILIASLLKKKDWTVWERVKGGVSGSVSWEGVGMMKIVERHAELIWAEGTLLKAVIGIIYSGDFLAFVKEALNMRNAYSTYRTLARFVLESDLSYSKSHPKDPKGEDPSIDNDFRSGVFLGNGMISLILSMLPGSVLKLMTVFGFTGDRTYALETLMKAGGWKSGIVEPGVPVEEEGIRRPMADMMLLTYHLVFATYLPVGGVDVPTAGNILRWNLDRYPNGIFFLYFSGRLLATETLLPESIISFQRAITAQKEYVQLGHICVWDLGLVALAKGDYKGGYEKFELLGRESNWSKAIYGYAMAVTLYEEGRELEKAAKTMSTVTDLMQRIAGKSIPLEKFVSRRSRKFLSQSNRLALPGLELAYVFNCMGLSPRSSLLNTHLNKVDTFLVELGEFKKGLNSEEEYWDDFCLAHLLRAILLRFIAHPEPHVVLESIILPLSMSEFDAQAFVSLSLVLKYANKLDNDHHLAWFAYYEMGKHYEAKKEYLKAEKEYQIVLSGKIPEVASSKKMKGKVSLQNMVVLRSNAALLVLKEDKKI